MKTLALGFTGTRNYLTRFQTERVEGFLGHYFRIGFTRFHFGDCVGADAYAAHVAWDLGYHLVCHPPVNDKLRAFSRAHEFRPPADYLIRNTHIVNESHLGLVVPHSEVPVEHSGTWSTLNKFARKGIPYLVVSPTRMWTN